MTGIVDQKVGAASFFMCSISRPTETLKRIGIFFTKETEVSANEKHIQLDEPDEDRIELFGPSTVFFPLGSRIVSRKQSFTEWLLAIVLSLMIVGLFLGAIAFMLFVNK